MIIDPPPHDGINVWMLSTARKCQLAGMAAWEAERQIMAFNGSARRPFKPGEVKRAVEKAYNTTLATSEFVRTVKPKWQPRQTRRTSYRNIPDGISLADLWESSPDRMDEGMDQSTILQWLLPDPDGLVCVGKSAFDFHTARLSDFKDLTQCQFIVPGYMSAKYGTTQDGKRSMHCLDNCGPRRFCVCDFDEPKSDEHPAIIWQLRKAFDLVMVLSSGGKSLHAWFNVPADEEADFWAEAVPRGADPALMRNRSSFVRIPYGTRDSGARQMPFYFDQSKLPEC
jgi:hypothetical protein